MSLWDDDDKQEFRDIPEETGYDENGQPRQSPVPRVQMQTAPMRPHPTDRPSNIPAEPEPQPVARFEGDIDLDAVLEDDDFTGVSNDANLRIEQGRLYQMIMNNDLFENMDADPRAVQNVHREMKKFARERMETMLGMRQEPLKAAPTASPFNDLEVEILKRLASKATNGATESPEANKVAETVRETPRRQTFKPISGSASARRPVVAPPKPQPAQTKLQTRAAPIQRKREDATVEQILAEEGVTREELEAVFPKEYKPLDKPVHQLSEQEMVQRARETARRIAQRKTVKSPSALPMATAEQQEMLAMQRATQIGAAPGMAAILDKVKSMPVKNP